MFTRSLSGVWFNAALCVPKSKIICTTFNLGVKNQGDRSLSVYFFIPMDLAELIWFSFSFL